MTEYAGTGPEAAGPGAAGPGHRCQGCGTRVQPDSQFCPRCGAAASAAGAASPPPWAFPTQPPPLPAVPPPGFGAQAPRGTGRGHALPVLGGIAAGVIALAGVATGVVFVAHPFGLDKPTASVSSIRPGAAGPAPSPASVAVTPESAPASGTPGAASPAEQQAAEGLSSLLSQSVSDRQQVNAAFDDAGQCGPDIEQDVQTFQDAQTSRQQLLDQLSSLPGLGSLPQAMVADLRSSWQASVTVDGDYVMWAQDQLDDVCSTDNEADPNYAAADAPNAQATAGKTAFVQQWNPLAESYGLPTYSQGDL